MNLNGLKKKAVLKHPKQKENTKLKAESFIYESVWPKKKFAQSVPNTDFDKHYDLAWFPEE
ncbi:hypothetical protein G9A89_002523 [Geosiphon pyriformis]|nr:hypothetical protein G9A89_002523 [Geosiphon pyriformis]